MPSFNNFIRSLIPPASESTSENTSETPIPWNKEDILPKEYAEGFLQLLNPIAPHITEELWSILGHNETISYEKWPVYDEQKSKSDEYNLPIQVNGKLRANITIPFDTDEAVIKEKAHGRSVPCSGPC